MDNEVSQAMLELFELYQKKIEFDSIAAVTVEGVIESVEDEALGLYNVNYMGSSFLCYAGNPEIVYSEGADVQILVPEGDFTKDKMILGYASPLSNDKIFSEDVAVGDIYYDISDNLFNQDLGLFNLCSYVDFQSQEISLEKISGDLINAYVDDGKTFSFSCEIKTSLEQTQQSVGNYGITLKIPVIVKEPFNDEEGLGIYKEDWKTYTLDTTNISGNPYRLNSWSQQNLYFTFDENTKYDDSRTPFIEYFNSGFAGPNTEEDKTTIDIQLRNVEWKAVEIINEADVAGYNLVLLSSQGPYYTSELAYTKTITPTLRYNGRTVKLDSDSIDIYWFKENIEVKPDHQLYLPYGGWGWMCINNQESVIINDDGTETIDYNTHQTTLDITRDDVKASARYKCVIIHNGNQVSQVVYLKNLDGDYSVNLYSATGSTHYVTGIGEVNLYIDTYIKNFTNSTANRSALTYTWARYDKEGSRINDEETFFVTGFNNNLVDNKYFRTSVSFSVAEIDTLNTVRCTVKRIRDNGETEIIGTESIDLVTSSDYSFRLSIDNDDIIYKYDVDGHSPMADGYEGPPTSRVLEIAPLSYTFRKDDGTELTNAEYAAVNYKWKIPKQSLFTIPSLTEKEEDGDYYIVQGRDNNQHNANLPYSLRAKYVPNYTHGQIELEVTFNGETFSQRANIAFTKEGETGTNGTALSAILKCNGSHYGELDENKVAKNLKFLYNTKTGKLYFWDWNNKTRKEWTSATSNQFPILPVVYLDAEPLSASDYTVTYSMLNYSTNETNPCFSVSSSGRLTFNKAAVGFDKTNCNIVEAEIKVLGQGSVANENEVLFAYYPIDFAITDLDSEIMPSIDSGFTEVMYEQDGTNPQFDETNPFAMRDCNSTVEDLSEFFDINWESSTYWSDKQKRFTFTLPEEGSTLLGYEAKARPTNKYDDANTNNYIAVKLTTKGNTSQLIEATKQKLQENLNTLATAVSDEVKNRNYLNAVAASYNSLQFDKKTEALKDFYTYRTRCEQTLTEIKNRLDDFEVWLEVQELVITSMSPLDNVKKAIEDASAKIKSLNSTSDIITISNAKITIPSNSDLVHDYGYDYTRAIEEYVESINSRIENYDKKQRAWLLEEANKHISSFNNQTAIQLHNDIKNSLNSLFIGIKSDAYDYLVNFKQSCENFLDKATVAAESYVETKAIINTLYQDYLKVYFVLDSVGTLRINSATDTLLAEEAASAKQDITESETKLEGLENIQNFGSSNKLYCFKPILLYYNRYSKSNINGWNGNKVEIGEENENSKGYLLAPQVGAGYKNSDNSFSGLTIGLRNVTGANSNPTNGDMATQPGLFAYNRGVQTVWIDSSTGTTVLGKVGGAAQFVIDTRGSEQTTLGTQVGDSTSTGHMLLYSTNFFSPDKIDSATGLPKITSYKGQMDWTKRMKKQSYENGEGMLIDFSAPSITFGNRKFFVTYEGILHAGGADSEDSSGDVSGWNLLSDRLESGNYENSRHLNSEKGICIKSSSTPQELTDDGLKDATYTNDKANPYIHFGDSQAEMMSGRHINLNSYTDGFYLSNQGLSIGERVLINSEGSMYLGALKSTKHWTISSTNSDKTGGTENDTAFIAYNRGNTGEENIDLDTLKNNSFLLTTDGMVISRIFRIYATKDDTERNNVTGAKLEIGNLAGKQFWTIAGTGEESYIAYNKTSIDDNSTAVGAFISTNGIRIGNRFLVDVTKTDSGQNQFIKLGNLNSSSGKYWEINAATSGDNSYIRYGKDSYTAFEKPTSSDAVVSKADSDLVYIGTDGIRLGNGFQIDSAGETLLLGSINKERHWTISSQGNDNNENNSYIGYKRHSLKGSISNSVYIGTNGIRLGNRFLVDIDNAYNAKKVSNGAIYLGRLEDLDNGEENEKARYWTIAANLSGNSCISYGGYFSFDDAKADQENEKARNSVYIGTDGITLGNTFRVDNAGNMTAASGTIAGWTITKNYLMTRDESKKVTGPNNITYAPGIVINKDGSIAGGMISDSGQVYTDKTKPLDSSSNKSDKYWRIDKDGSAQFDGVEIGGGNNSFVTGYAKPNDDPNQATVYINEDGNAWFHNIHIRGTNTQATDTTPASLSDIQIGNSFNVDGKSYTNFWVDSSGYTRLNNVTITDLTPVSGTGGSAISLSEGNYYVKYKNSSNQDVESNLPTYVQGFSDRLEAAAVKNISVSGNTYTSLNGLLSALASQVSGLASAGYATTTWVSNNFASSDHTHSYASANHTHTYLRASFAAHGPVTVGSSTGYLVEANNEQTTSKPN